MNDEERPARLRSRGAQPWADKLARFVHNARVEAELAAGRQTACLRSARLCESAAHNAEVNGEDKAAAALYRRIAEIHREVADANAELIELSQALADHFDQNGATP